MAALVQMREEEKEKKKRKNIYGKTPMSQVSIHLIEQPVLFA